MRKALRYFWQRLTRGFDDREVWELGHSTFYRWIVPRLKVFRENISSYPNSMQYGMDWEKPLCTDEQAMERWKEILDEMVEGFSLGIEDDLDPANRLRIDRAHELFMQHRINLWD